MEEEDTILLESDLVFDKGPPLGLPEKRVAQSGRGGQVPVLDGRDGDDRQLPNPTSSQFHL